MNGGSHFRMLLAQLLNRLHFLWLQRFGSSQHQEDSSSGSQGWALGPKPSAIVGVSSSSVAERPEPKPADEYSG